MINSAFPLGEEIKLHTVNYRLHPPSWTSFNVSGVIPNFGNWITFKYLNNSGTNFSDKIDLLPANKGGLYLFSINCPIIPGITEYPAYIGRAQLTTNQNLRKRCKEYFLKYSRNGERPKITTLFNYWKNNLYLSFIVVDGNDKIREYESKLINSLLLPFNDEIPNKEYKQAIEAFEL